MPRTKSHAHRYRDGETVTCECGETFNSDGRSTADAKWRRHYEKSTSATERKTAEGRDEPEEETE